MAERLKLEKDYSEHPVPEALRPTFRKIADAFVAGDYTLRSHPIEGVAPVDPEVADLIESNVTAYGDALAPLDEETWVRSIYQWEQGYWEFLVDLTTENQPVSDLTLHAKLWEADFRLEIWSVHVP